jgi:hypothetical protein
MDIQSQKLELIEWLASVKDVSIIKAFLELKEKNEADWWNNLSEEEKEDIEVGIADLEAGRKKDFKEVIKKYR